MATTPDDQAMNDLTPRERELVALGAAFGSNCVPCVEFHIAASRKLGFRDAQILAAIGMADTVRQVPARKVLDVATEILGASVESGDGEQACCD